MGVKMLESNQKGAFDLIRHLQKDYPDIESMWRLSRAGDLPEPLDAIWFECYVHLHFKSAFGVLRAACLPFLTPSTNVWLFDETIQMAAKLLTVNLEESLLLAQAGFYVAHSPISREYADTGLFRVHQCFEWLLQWHDEHRPPKRAPLIHSVNSVYSMKEKETKPKVPAL